MDITTSVIQIETIIAISLYVAAFIVTLLIIGFNIGKLIETISSTHQLIRDDVKKELKEIREMVYASDRRTETIIDEIIKNKLEAKFNKLNNKHE